MRRIEAGQPLEGAGELKGEAGGADCFEGGAVNYRLVALFSLKVCRYNRSMCGLCRNVLKLES